MPLHDKTNNMSCAPGEDSDQPGLSPSLISFHYALNRYLRAQCFFMRAEKTDQTERVPRLILVFPGCTAHFVGFVMQRLNYKYVTYIHFGP